MAENQRLTDRLTSYWNGIRKEASVPDFSQFNIATMQDDWQQCVLFTVEQGTRPANVKFYAIGDRVKKFYGRDVIGHRFTPGQRLFQGAALMRRMGEIIDSPGPMVDTGQFVNEQSKV
ncbi:MAG: PAS domain-containing protein [Alphaproteobacteria bacterium]